MKSFRNRTCKNCGWVHFAVSMEFAKSEVNRFNKYFITLTEREQRDNYGGIGAALREYLTCFRCGGPHTNFRASNKGDCPSGCTIGPIVYEPKKRKKK